VIHAEPLDRRVQIGLPEALGAVLAVTAFVLPLAAGVFWGAAVGVSLVLSIVPLALYAVLHRRGGRVGLPVRPGLFVSAGYSIFFAAGITAWSLNGREVSVGFVQRPTGTAVAELVAAICAATCAFVVGEFIAGNRPSRAPAADPRKLFGLAQALFAIALAGAAFAVRDLGGWNAAVDLLTTHNKQELSPFASSLGLSLWTIFALPALVALGLVALGAESRARVRLVSLVELCLLGYLGVALFGSRLVVTLGAIGIVGGHYGPRGKRLRLRDLAIGVGVLLALSSVVLGTRSTPSYTSSRVQQQLRILGYGTFDVTLGAWGHRDTLGPEFRSVRRTVRLGSSLIPGFGRRTSALAADRVDVMTVRALGSAAQVNTTGLPPSLPTYLLVAFGPLLPLLFAFAGGLASGALWDLLRSRGGAAASLFVGLWCAFVFNDFKDGDLVVNLVGEAKRWAYVGVVVLVVRCLTTWSSKRVSA
jgi:hypothetical protein